MLKEQLNNNEAAGHLNVSPATLNKWRCYGGGPRFAKLGKKVIYRRSDLDAWINERVRASTSEGDAA